MNPTKDNALITMSNSIIQNIHVYSSTGNYKSKGFDSWNYVSCPDEKQDALVEDLVLKYTPVGNSALRTNVKWISKTRAKNKYGFNKNEFNKRLKEGCFSEVKYFGDVYVLMSEFKDIRMVQAVEI